MLKKPEITVQLLSLYTRRNSTLKIYEHELSPSTVKYGFRTFNYKVIPSELEKSGRKIRIEAKGIIISRPVVLRSPNGMIP
jgi:hypothetical protein